MSASHQVVNDFEVRAILKRTSGGDSETELNELTVAPTRVPSLVIVVTTATPVGKRPRASLKLRSENVMVPSLEALATPAGKNRLAECGDAASCRPYFSTGLREARGFPTWCRWDSPLA